jgi:hypothetical protein
LIGYGAASTVVAACRLAGAFEPRARSDAPIAILIVDERFALARRAAALGAPGVPRVAMPRDVLDLWHSHLASIVQTRRHAIAGVTTERGFFVVHTLAANHRLRVLSRSLLDMPRLGHEPLVSWIVGPG